MRFDVRVGLVACVALAGSAWAQDYPVKPVRLVVPYPAGSSSNDIIGRFLAQKLSALLGEQVEGQDLREFLAVDLRDRP